MALGLLRAGVTCARGLLLADTLPPRPAGGTTLASNDGASLAAGDRPGLVKVAATGLALPLPLPVAAAAGLPREADRPLPAGDSFDFCTPTGDSLGFLTAPPADPGLLVLAAGDCSACLVLGAGEFPVFFPMAGERLEALLFAGELLDLRLVD